MVKSGNEGAELSVKPTHSCSTNHPITKLKSASALNQLLVLSDEMLIVLDLESLEHVRQLKFKNITTFCFNENPVNEDPFTVEICLAVKKKIQYVYLNDEQVKIVKEYPTNTTPAAIAMDGVHTCFSSSLDYYLINILTGTVQQLFSRDTPEQAPIILRVSCGEFLLTGPGSLGVFVSTEGISERPPIQFSHRVSSLAFHHPYILAVDAIGINIYSLIDQQCKQIITVPNVRCLVDGDGQIYAVSSIDLFSLHAISWQVQVEKLISENRLQEALQLATNAHISSNTKEQHQAMIDQLQFKAAKQYLANKDFAPAMELLEMCIVDCRQVNLLYLFARMTCECFCHVCSIHWHASNRFSI